MNSYRPMTANEQAVQFALLSSKIAPAAVPIAEYMLEMANAFLSEQTLPSISMSELQDSINILINSNLLRINEDGSYTLLTNPSLGGRTKREWDPAKLVAKRNLTEAIPLVNTFLFGQGERYEILFNSDGKGGIKLPDETTVYINLNALDDQLCRQRNLTNTAGKGSGHKWFVEPDSVPHVTKRMNIQAYLDEFYPEV